MVSTLRKKRILAATAVQQVAIGINFRFGPTFVTDGPGETYCQPGSTYPTVRGGYTFGWVTTGIQSADRNNAVDRRLAAVCYETPPRTFRMDLPSAGNYEIRLAFGDTQGNHPDMSAVFKDGATTLFSLLNKANAFGSFFDALGVEYSTAAWPAGNSPRTVTMVGTALTIELSCVSNVWSIAHVSAVLL